MATSKRVQKDVITTKIYIYIGILVYNGIYQLLIQKTYQLVVEGDLDFKAIYKAIL